MGLVALMVKVAILGLVVYVLTEIWTPPAKFVKVIYLIAALILGVLVLQVLGIDTGIRL